jgi:3'-phosphoadenosine 5'-phosphosulfate sulfotransferase (PAPS reductase)/FAD synthetase
MDAERVETVSAMGVRAEESEARSKMAAFELDDDGPRTWGGWVWRPLIAWTITDVLAIHHRHGVPVNPLYQQGFGRVGCFPCIFSNKEEIRTLADTHPERIDIIEALEAEAQAVRDQRNTDHASAAMTADGALPDDYEPRYTNDKATFFQTRDRVAPQGIRSVVEWSRTSRGGRQLPLLAEPPTGGCMRWGMCEPPPKEPRDDDEAAKPAAEGEPR